MILGRAGAWDINVSIPDSGRVTFAVERTVSLKDCGSPNALRELFVGLRESVDAYIAEAVAADARREAVEGAELESGQAQGD